MEKIIVVFKTHLDLGFTDFGKNIAEKYQKEYIPNAITIGEEILRQSRKEGFVWTTGSWLISQYLQKASPAEYKRMCEAIEAGIIRWHALPFTMHSELASSDLYKYGLSLSHELDKQFNLTTISAKNTDVPSSTCAIVPLLAKAGVKFLHVGVNPASTPPEVPSFFRWYVPSGENIVVMYDKGDYGQFSKIPGTETAIYFAHTGDNLGPQSTEEITQIYETLHREYPEAIIKAGSLDDAAKEVLKIQYTLPIVTEEIGDSWIHGVGSAPARISQYRALLRLAEKSNSETAEKLYEYLLRIPEHTWGLDVKSCLGNKNRHYKRTDFESVRDTPPYERMETSWQEQQDYITKAIHNCPLSLQEEAKLVAGEYKREYPDFSDYQRLQVSPDGEWHIMLQNWEITIDRLGAVSKLKKDTHVLADKSHRLGLFQYEVFSEKEVIEYGKRYDCLQSAWSQEDFGKISLSKDMEKYQKFNGICEAVYYNDKELFAEIKSDAVAYEQFGCPQKMLLNLRPDDTQIFFDFSWFNKPANRIPESCELLFCPTQPLVTIEKMEMEINPQIVVSNGNREMHATSGLLKFEGCTLYTWDAPLIGIAQPSIYAFFDQVPPLDQGVWFNLFNNQWGTNFTMWYDEDARFRFTLSFNEE